MAEVHSTHDSPAEDPDPGGTARVLVAPDRRAAAEAPASDRIAVTIGATVDRDRLPELKRVLRSMGRNPGGNAVFPLAALPRVHFARLFVLDATTDLDGSPIEPQLLLMADIDAPASSGPALERCLEEMVDVAGAGLDRVFGPCLGYPSKRTVTRPRRLAFLRRHAIGSAAVYVNTVGRSVRQIGQEEHLRLAIEGFLDASDDWTKRDPGQVRDEILAFVGEQPDLAWALTEPPGPGLGARVRDAVDLLRWPLGLVVLAPAVVPTLPLIAVLIRRMEQQDPSPHIRPTAEHVRRLAELEDHGPQNQFSAVGFVKPGPVRRLVVEGVTGAISSAAKHVFGHADLAGVTSIHSARWVFLDDHRRMVFASNYDGSVENYNDDFIDKVWWGLNAVFSNGVGYPATRWLFFGGATKEQEFKDYLRCHQVPTQVWFSAYPRLTAINIENNARIRAGLHGSMSEEGAQRWLRRL